MSDNNYMSDREITAESKQALQKQDVGANLIQITEELLLDTRNSFLEKSTLSMPVAQLSTLGAGVASLIPSLRAVTQTTTVNTQGLYRLANAGVGDTLKVAKNGNFWGAFKTAKGTSKFAQLQSAGPITATSTTVSCPRFLYQPQC